MQKDVSPKIRMLKYDEDLVKILSKIYGGEHIVDFLKKDIKRKLTMNVI